MKKQINFEQFGLTVFPQDRKAIFDPTKDKTPIDAILRKLEKDLGQAALSYSCQGVEEQGNRVHYKILFGHFEKEEIKPNINVWVAF